MTYETRRRHQSQLTVHMLHADYNSCLVHGRLSSTVIKTQYHVGGAVALHHYVAPAIHQAEDTADAATHERLLNRMRYINSRFTYFT